MTLHGYELLGEWRNSNCGKIVTATKGGKRYFLKKYQTPVAPIKNGALDAKTFANNEKKFNDFVADRTRINRAIRAVSGPGGNIIIPCEEFIDGNQFVEASEFVEGVIGDDELEAVLGSLSLDVKLLLMKTAAAALSTVHNNHVVHSDLKLKNVLLVKNAMGRYVAKLIDFDSSYFLDKKPDEVIGSIDYYAPELGIYADIEDPDEKKAQAMRLTEKADIFSLGLIFHFYMAGALPEAINLTERLQRRKDKGKPIYAWVALNSHCDLKLSDKITNAKYTALIRDMLSLDPAQRPTASKVLRRLNGADPVIEEPWPEHNIMLQKPKLEAAGIAGLKAKLRGTDKVYEILFKDGRRQDMTREDLLRNGYAKAVAPGGFAEPWPEHGIEFDVERLKSRGFVSGERGEMSGVKGYYLYRADSNSTFFRVEMLLTMKYARKKAIPVSVETGFAEPWPEHRIVFDQAAIIAKGYARVERQTLGGINGYSFVRTNGTAQFIRVEMVLMQHMAMKT